MITPMEKGLLSPGGTGEGRAGPLQCCCAAWADVYAETWRMGTLQNQNSKESISGAGVGRCKSTAEKMGKRAEGACGQPRQKE